EQRWRRLYAEPLRGFEIDQQFEFRRPLDGKVFRLVAAEYPVDIARSLPKQFGNADAVRNQSALVNKAAYRTHGRKATAHSASDARCDLLEQFEPLRPESRLNDTEAGHVGAGVRKTLNEILGDRVTRSNENNWDSPRSGLRRSGRRIAVRKDYLGFEFHQTRD